MSMSPSATLFYGIAYDDFTKPESWEGLDWEEVLAKKTGLVAPVEEYNAEIPEIYRAYRDYWKACREMRELVGVEFGYAGYLGESDSTQKYIYITKSRQSVDWGAEPVRSFETDSGWKALVLKFCEMLEIPYVQPQWHIAAAYG